MPAAKPIEYHFDSAEEQFQINPLDDPRSIAESLEADPRLDIAGEYLERIADSPPLKKPCVVLSFALARGMPLAKTDQLKHREVSPLIFGVCLSLELTLREGPLEGGGAQNLFWIPELVTAYWDTTDDLLHVREWQPEIRRLARFDKLFTYGR